MSLGEQDGAREPAPDWPAIRNRAGSYAVLAVLVLLFGQQGWFLWRHSGAALAWLLTLPAPRRRIRLRSKGEGVISSL